MAERRGQKTDLSSLALILLLSLGCEGNRGNDVQRVTPVPPETASQPAPAPAPSPASSPAPGVVPPTVVSRVEPEFPDPPAGATIAPITVEAVVDAHGAVTSVTVVSGGDTVYSRAVADAVRQWKFRPGTVDGQPAQMPHRVTARIDPR